MREELRDDPHRLLVIVVQAVLLESDFVGFDSFLGMLANQRTGSTISLSYTMREILRNRGNTGREVERVVLKFQNLGHFVNVYGCLENDGSSPYQVCLDKNRFSPTIDFVYETQNVIDRDGFVLELWKIVKNEITFPLLIDLCAKAGLPAPSSLMRLLPELKMKILESILVIEHKPYDHKADIFSFGVVLLELLTGKLPYEHLTPLQAAVGVAQKGLRPTIPMNTPPKLAELLDKCWQQDPVSRPDFSEIIEILQALAKEVYILVAVTWQNMYNMSKGDH